MDWIVRLNEAIGYIEDNLEGTVDVRVAARIACCSTFHFIRMFTYIAGIPLSEYIRKRRLTLAAFDIQQRKGRIIDIALRYGYESPTAFNRAFHMVHGISPSEAKKPSTVLRAYPRMHFSLAVTGGREMVYRIEEKPSFTVVGVGRRFSIANDACYAEIPRFWESVVRDGLVGKMMGHLNTEPVGLMGISSTIEDREFDYYIAVPSTDNPAAPLAVYEIPGGTWAVFDCIGPMPHAIQELQKRIVTEWLPTSKYEYADGPDIEFYFDGDRSSDDYRSEVWLPVRKKSN